MGKFTQSVLWMKYSKSALCLQTLSFIFCWFLTELLKDPFDLSNFVGKVCFHLMIIFICASFCVEAVLTEKTFSFSFFFFYITAKQVSVFLRPITSLRIIRALWTLQNTKCSFHLFPMTESHYSFLKAWLLNGGNERCKLKVRRSERKEAV